MNIYSKDGQLLHIIIRRQDLTEGRDNLIPEEEYLQCASLKLPKDTTFKAHKHNYQHREGMYIPQESWVVLRGAVKVMLYDLDDTLLHEDVLTAGDVSVTLRGGHNYLIMQDGTEVLEYKTGPYLGQGNDKTFICLRS